MCVTAQRRDLRPPRRRLPCCGDLAQRYLLKRRYMGGIALSVFGSLVSMTGWAQTVTLNDSTEPNYDIRPGETVTSVIVDFPTVVPPATPVITNEGTITSRPGGGSGLRINSKNTVLYESDGGRLFGGIRLIDPDALLTISGSGLVVGPIDLGSANNEILRINPVGSEVLTLRSNNPNSTNPADRAIFTIDQALSILPAPSATPLIIAPTAPYLAINGGGTLVIEGSDRLDEPVPLSFNEGTGILPTILETGTLEFRGGIIFQGNTTPGSALRINAPTTAVTDTGPTLRIDGRLYFAPNEQFDYRIVDLPGGVERYGQVEFVVRNRGNDGHGRLVFSGAPADDPFPIADDLRYGIVFTDLVGEAALDIVVVDGAHNATTDAIMDAEVASNSQIYRARFLDTLPSDKVAGVEGLRIGQDAVIRIERRTDEELGLSGDYPDLLRIVLGGLRGDEAALAFHEISSPRERRRALDDLRPDVSAASVRPVLEVMDVTQEIALTRANDARFDNRVTRGTRGIGGSGDDGDTTAWTKGLFHSITQEGTVARPGFAARSIGFATGIDRRVNDRAAMVGVSYGFAHTQTDARDGSRTTHEITTNTLQLYGSSDIFDGDGYFSFVMGVAQNDSVSKRDLPYFERQAKSDAISYSLGARFETGGRLSFANMFQEGKAVDVAPHIGLRVLRALSDERQERGAGGLNLLLSRPSYQRLQIVGGISARTRFSIGKEGELGTLVTARVTHEVEEDEATVTISTPISPNNKQVFGLASPARLAFTLTARASYRLSQSLSMDIGYEASFSEAWAGHRGDFTVGYIF